MATFILDGWLCPPPHGECQCYGEVFCHSLDNFSQQRGSLLERLCCSTSLFKIPQRCSVGIKSGGILGQVIVFTIFFRNSCLILAVCFESLSCWNIISYGKCLKTGSLPVGQYFSASTGLHGAIYKCPLPKPFALMQPHISTFPPPFFTVGTMHSLW